MKGYGLQSVLWVGVQNAEDPSGIYAIDNDGNVVFDACAVEGGIIESGVNEGEQISVYNMSGQHVSRKASTGMSTFIPMNGNGIYVVQSKNGTKKVIKK